MYSVLIVEDELLVRIGLKNSIPWSKYEMEVIGDVANGRDALKVYEEEKPDLIITDLKMPVMDGLELISEIRKKDQDTKILILSCIEEFEYARKAASLKVSGYILKLTMTEDEMEEVLSSVHKELQARQSLAPLTLNHRVNLNMLKEKLVKDYLFYRVYSDEELAEQLKQLGSRLALGRTAMAMLEPSPCIRLLRRFDDDRGELIHFTMLNVLNEILNNHGAGEAFHDRNHRYLLIFSFDDQATDEEIRLKWNEIFANVQKVMRTYFDVPVFIGVSSLSRGFAKWRQLYQECSQVMEGRYFSEADIVFYAAWSPERGHESKWKQMTLQSCRAWAKLGPVYLEDLKRETERRLADTLPDEQSWKRLFTELIDWTLDYLGIPQDQAALMELTGSEQVRASVAIADAVKSWENHLTELAKLKGRIKSVSKEVAEAVQFIRQRYDQNITLKEISEHVQLSPNYLSLLFKKEMGRNLIEYLTDYRMEKAKEMLLHTTLKTYEIAENVGVSDSAYFSRIFKKTTGVSPVEFRRKKVLERNPAHDENS